MKEWKRIVCLNLVLILLLSALPISVLAALSDPLAIGSYTVNASGEKHYVDFTPSEDGMYWLYVSPGTVTGSNLSLYKDNEEYPSIKDEASIIFALLESGQTYRVEHPDDELDHMFWWYEDLKETYYPREYTLYAKRSECNTLHENVAHSFTTSELISIDTWIDNTYRNFSKAFFSFTPTFGGSYQFNVSSSDYCWIEIYNYNGQYISSNNSTYALNSNEQYIVMISSIEGNATGSITVKKADEGQGGSDTEVNVISRTPEDLLLEQPFNISITFDHEVESIDTSGNSGRLLIVTKDSSENLSTVYELSETSSIRIEGNTLIIDITQVNWEPGKEYSVLLDYGVITFKDTDARVGYSYGQWTFRTPVINLALITPEVWKFNNSYPAFGTEDASKGYYITREDYNRLTSLLSNSEKKKISSSLGYSTYNIDGRNTKNVNWNGSCYGMSIWICLASRGIRNAEEIDTAYSNLYRVDYPFKNGDIASAINYYQQQQRLSGIVMQQAKFICLSQEQQIKELETVAKNANYTGNYGLVLLEWKEGLFSKYKHAIVVYGYEDGREWRVKANGTTKTYSKRALIYDCSYPYSDTFDQYCIYFDDYSWCIPGYNITSSFNSLLGTLGNGSLQLVTNDIEVLNTVDFASGNVSSEAYSELTSDALFGLNAGATFEIHAGNNFCTVENGEIIESSFENPPIIILDAAVPTDGDADISQTATLVLYDPDSTYTIITKEPICYDIKYANFYMAAISEAAGRVEFSPDGSIQLKGDADVEYTLQMVADDGYHTIPWYDITVTGSELNEISAEWITEGVKVSGDNLNKLSVTASNDNETVTLEVNTDYNDILLKDNNGSLGAYVDTNHDGIFETLIEEDENYHPGSGNGGSPSTNYLVDVKSSEHGNISVNRRMVSHGEEVIIFVSPDEGYALDTLRVVDKNGHNIVVTGDNNRYSFKMPASDVTISGTFIKVIANDVFVDVDINDYYYNAVLWANENGITKGTSSTAFSPDANCTRGQVVTFLWRAVGSPTPQATTMPFVDIPADAYYYDAVLWAVENGITKGTSATKFSPDAICTRSQVVTFLWRVEGAPSFQKVDLRFDDVPQNAYYFNAVLWADTEKITTGTSTNTFSPMAYCTRAEIVTLIWRWSSM